MTRLQLVFWRVEDNLRYSRLVRSLLAWRHYLQGRLAWKLETRIRHLCKALGLGERRGEWSFILREIQPVINLPNEPIWRRLVEKTPRYASLLHKKPHLTRSVILKAPGDGGEKGVLLNYFEYNLARVLALSDEELAWLDDHYHLIFVPSWSPTDYALIGSALLRLKSPLFIQCANEIEREKLSAFDPRLICLPGLACDWVDPAFYRPKPFADRSIDILMVANWGAFKRHWEFFAALTHLPTDLRVVLVGQQEGGRDKAFIQSLARRLGVPQKLELMESLSIEEVTDLECDARVSVILSRREGGCVAAVESLFAGCALAMRSDARIGSSAHINSETGKRLRPGRIAEDLKSTLAECANLSPREWSCAHIGNELTLKRINEVIRDHAQSAGQAWNEDLALPRWRPHPTLARVVDRDRLQPVYANLHSRFPNLFGPDLMAKSHH